MDTQSAYLGATNRGDLTKTAGLMSNKRDPRAPAKLDAESLKNRQFANPELSALIIERNSLVEILKANCMTVREAETLQPEKHREYIRLTGRIRGIRKNLGRAALKDSRAKWLRTPTTMRSNGN